MLPTIHDVEIKFGAVVQCEIQEQSRNDKDHPTSNTDQNTSIKRVQHENQEHNTMPQCFPNIVTISPVTLVGSISV